MSQTFLRTHPTLASFLRGMETISLPSTVVSFFSLGIFLSSIPYDISIMSEGLSIVAVVASIYYCWTIARVKSPAYRQVGAGLILVATTAYLMPVSMLSDWSVSILTDLTLIYFAAIGCMINRGEIHG